MLEIELTNQLNSASFKSADKKIALLPHCLRDLTVECKAAPDGFDYKCRHCSKLCYQNEVSAMLTNNGIETYIWMGADIKNEAKSVVKSQKILGILGIACIPELVAEMRLCQKYKLPVINLPLDSNRCVRWMGSFNENSVNLEILEKLIAKWISSWNKNTHEICHFLLFQFKSPIRESYRNKAISRYLYLCIYCAFTVHSLCTYCAYIAQKMHSKCTYNAQKTPFW